MSDPPRESPSNRLSIIWSPEAREQLRAVDREKALQILYCRDRFLLFRTGDLKRLKPPLIGFRLRCGDYRVFFEFNENNSTIGITAVFHRKDAYR